MFVKRQQGKTTLTFQTSLCIHIFFEFQLVPNGDNFTFKKSGNNRTCLCRTPYLLVIQLSLQWVEEELNYYFFSQACCCRIQPRQNYYLFLHVNIHICIWDLCIILKRVSIFEVLVFKKIYRFVCVFWSVTVVKSLQISMYVQKSTSTQTAGNFFYDFLIVFRS